MSKIGADFELGYSETLLMERIRSIRGVRFLSLTWKSESKDHMKWGVRCNEPKAARNSLGSIRVEYGRTPVEALRKIAQALRIENVSL